MRWIKIWFGILLLIIFVLVSILVANVSSPGGTDYSKEAIPYLLPFYIASMGIFISLYLAKASTLLSIEKELFETYDYLDVNDELSEEERSQFNKYISKAKKKRIFK